MQKFGGDVVKKILGIKDPTGLLKNIKILGGVK
jgi:hypothetical protein